MRKAALMVVLFGCATADKETGVCAFSDQPATYTDPAANGVTVEDVQAEVVGTSHGCTPWRPTATARRSC